MKVDPGNVDSDLADFDALLSDTVTVKWVMRRATLYWPIDRDLERKTARRSRSRPYGGFGPVHKLPVHSEPAHYFGLFLAMKLSNWYWNFRLAKKITLAVWLFFTLDFFSCLFPICIWVDMKKINEECIKKLQKIKRHATHFVLYVYFFFEVAYPLKNMELFPLAWDLTSWLPAVGVGQIRLKASSLLMSRPLHKGLK